MDNVPENNLYDSSEEQPGKEYSRLWLWQGFEKKTWLPGLRGAYIFVSIIIDIVLILALIILLQQQVTLRRYIAESVLVPLYDNFVAMDTAIITANIKVQDTIQVVDTMPIQFDLPLEQATEVVLTKDTPIKNATIVLNNQPVPLDLTLKAGTPLNINLDLIVPVSQTIPVRLAVPVDLNVPVSIPISRTQLHDPFIGLQVFAGTYAEAIYAKDHGCTGFLSFLCDWFFVYEE